MRKTYQITEGSGVVHTLTCDYIFNNAGELTLRSGKRGDTTLVGLFPAGCWTSCVEKIDNGKEPERETDG